MNRFTKFLSPENIELALAAPDKKCVFEWAGLLFEKTQVSIAHDIVTKSLFAREQLGSTGLGEGVAIPHGRIKGLKYPAAALIRLAEPIAFDAPDNQPVTLLIILLVPEQATQQHLELLSEIVQLLSDQTIRASLNTETDKAALYHLLTTWDA